MTQTITAVRQRVRRLRRITVGTFKGGVGKTTTAILLALAAILLGRKVMVVCTDTVNRGATRWVRKARQRGYTEPFKFVQYVRENGPLAAYLEDLEAANPEIDLIIVDLGGENANAFAETASWADWLVSPIEPEEGGLSGVEDTYNSAAAIARLRERAGDTLYHSFLLVCCPVVGRGLAATARTELEDDQRDERGRPGDREWSVGAHVFATEIGRNGAYSGLWGTMPQLLDEETGREELGDYANLWDEMVGGWEALHPDDTDSDPAPDTETEDDH